jgi:hypothetical protein
MPGTIEGRSVCSGRCVRALASFGLALFSVAVTLQANTADAFTTTVITLDGTAGTNSTGTGYVPSSTNELALWFGFGSVSPVLDRTFGPNGETKLERVGQPITLGMPYGSLVAAFADDIDGTVPPYMQFMGEQGVINLQAGHVGNELHVGLNMSAADYAALDGLMQVVLITAGAGEFTEHNFVIDSESAYPISTGIHAASGDVLAFANVGALASQNGSPFGPEGRPLLTSGIQPIAGGTNGAVSASFGAEPLSSGFIVGDNGWFTVQPIDAGQELFLYPNLSSSQLTLMEGSFDVRVFHLHPVATSTAEQTAFGSGLSVGPNPMKNSSVAAFSLNEAAQTNLSIYDVTGKLVRRLVHGQLPVGQHRFTWDGRDTSGASVAAGVYFHELTTPNRKITNRVVVTR